MKLNICPNHQQMAAEVCGFLIDIIHQNPQSLLCFAGGDTPVPIYRLLVKAALAKQVDFRECRFVGLDEWVGIAPTDPGSCRYLLDHELFNPLGIPEERICFFNGNAADAHGRQQECAKINSWVEQYGPIDIMLLGIGVNGHLGFNEPGTSFDGLAHWTELQEITCKVGQKYFTDAPRLSMGITLGMAQIYQSKNAVLVANGANKAAIIKELMASEVSPDLPASILKTHPNSQIFLDEDAAFDLTTK